jgi:hypothetical protein
MYKYYLFIINNNAYKIYKNNSKYLYDILTTLYSLKGNDLVYGINLYNSICDTFSSKLLDNYLDTKATCRMSTYLYTSKEDIDTFVDAIINGGDILDAYFN